MEHEAPGPTPIEQRHAHLADSMVRAQEQARDLRSRIDALAREIAISEEGVARVLEESAQLRPHAAERLLRAAREARAFAAHERSVAWGASDHAPGVGERP